MKICEHQDGVSIYTVWQLATVCDNLLKAQVNFRGASDTVMFVYSSSPDIAAVKVFSLVLKH